MEYLVGIGLVLALFLVIFFGVRWLINHGASDGRNATIIEIQFKNAEHQKKVKEDIKKIKEKYGKDRLNLPDSWDVVEERRKIGNKIFLTKEK